jgi:acetylornithine deacetylase
LGRLGLDVDKFVPDLEQLRKHPAYVKEAEPYEGRSNVVAAWKGTGKGRSLLFNGHIDVIPEGADENWKQAEWSAISTGRQVYGRGLSI